MIWKIRNRKYYTELLYALILHSRHRYIQREGIYAFRAEIAHGAKCIIRIYVEKRRKVCRSQRKEWVITMYKICSLIGLTATIDLYEPIYMQYSYNMYNTLNDIILNLYKNDVNEFYAGTATGLDLICSDIIIRLKEKYPDIILHTVVPFIGLDFAWNKELKLLYCKILNGCDDIKYLQSNYTPFCYIKKYKYMINKCDIVVPLTESDSRDNNINAIEEYAKIKQKPVLYLNLKSELKRKEKKSVRPLNNNIAIPSITENIQ